MRLRRAKFASTTTATLCRKGRSRLGTVRYRHHAAFHLEFIDAGKAFFTVSQRKLCFWETSTGKLLREWHFPGHMKLAACNRDGSRVALQTSSHLEIWDVTANRAVHKIPLGDAPTFSACAFSHNGKQIVTADATPREHRIRLWDVAAGTQRVIGASGDEIEDLTVSADGERIYSSGSDAGTVCWDAAKGVEKWRLPEGWSWPRFSLDSKRFLVSKLLKDTEGRMDSTQKKCQLFDGLTGLAIGKEFFSAFSTEVISDDGKRVAFISPTGEVEIRAVDGWKKLGSWLGEGGPKLLAFRPGNDVLQVIEHGNVLQAYDGAGKRLYPDTKMWGHRTEAGSVVWSPNGRSVASSTSSYGGGTFFGYGGVGWSTSYYGEGTLFIWDVVGNLVRQRFEKTEQTYLAFSADSNKLFACETMSMASLDAATGKELTHALIQQDKEDKEVGGIQPLPDGKRMRLLFRKSRYVDEPGVALVTLNIESGRRVQNHKWTVSSSNCWLGRNIGIFDGRVFHADTGEEMPNLECGDGGDKIMHYATSPDDRLVVAGIRYPKNDSHGAANAGKPAISDLFVFERVTGRIIQRVPWGAPGPLDVGEFGSEPGPQPLAFSPDGRRLAAARLDSLSIWDLAAGQEARSYRAHERFAFWQPNSFATALAFSPDGKRIATAHPDTTLLIWDAVSPPLPKAAALTKAELEALWSNLAGFDPAKAMDAVWKLQGRPEQALALLKERLKPAALPDAARFRNLIVDLDSSGFREREVAMKKLTDLGDSAKLGLEKALENKLTAEQEKRVRELLGELDSHKPPHGDDLRGIRALAILEFIKSNESRELISALAAGLEGARLTREAKETLERQPGTTR